MPVTWDDIYELGMGVLSISRSELLQMTQRELLCCLSGYRKRQEEEWEKVRMISYYSAAPMMKKGFKISDVWVPTDKPKTRDKPSTRKTLSREELIETYKKSGFNISKERVDNIMKLRNGANRV